MTHNPNRPLRIAEIVTPASGLIGVTFAPGKKQLSAFSGLHDRDLATDLDVIARWNAAAVVTLLTDTEIENLKIADIARQVEQRFMEWHHLPIEDVSVPDADFEADWPESSDRLRSLLRAGANILIHCKGGLGRAGMIAGRLLVEMGIEPEDAIRKVRTARGEGAIETRAQERWVVQGKGAAAITTSTTSASIRDRAVGALVGLAVGDAVGTTLEFKPKPSHPVLTDMVGGGPFGLMAGQWTDDTAMALALGDWLANDPALDPAELASRFVRWYKGGDFSCTGTCFDIGNTTSQALNRFIETGEPLAGSKSSQAAGNGALMRLSPVAIRFWNDRPKLIEVARLQTATTHGAEECIEASARFAELLAEVISGKPLAEALAGEPATRIKGNWRGAHRDDIRGTGYVVDCLNAALWAVSRTTSFRSAILLAANLGDDADTTAAVAGQLAGAVYGVSGIPAEWLERLAWRPKIEAMADQLFEAGSAMQSMNDRLDTMNRFAVGE
jgi:ADP-ribosyl-[dinitrogen reductase] hydrolase